MPDFVLLKMSNEMPAQIRRQFRDFRSRFLNTTLAEQSLPSLDRLAYFLSRMRLCDGDKLNAPRSASNLRCRPRDLLAHPLEILRDRIHCRGGHIFSVDAYYLFTSVLGTSTAATTALIVP